MRPHVHNTNADICPDVSVMGQLLLFCQQSGIFATPLMNTSAPEEQPEVMFVIIIFLFHRYSRVLRGDLAAQRGANSGEGRCVGGNFLLHFTQHMLRVYIVSGAAFAPLPPRSLVAASVRCHHLRISLLDMDEADRCKRLRGKEKQAEIE